MPQKMISLRVSSALLERVERLMGQLERTPDYALRGRISRAEVLRDAILEGCDVLEKRYVASSSPSRHRASDPAEEAEETLHPATPPPPDNSSDTPSTAGLEGVVDQATPPHAADDTPETVPAILPWFPAHSMVVQPDTPPPANTTPAPRDERDEEFEPF
ncbi:MAG: hypothetical protein HQL50_04190 [Magnetococcales bacterium]|nr:hypothetical protein [Magnetococcales bacterium]